ncbi:MAG: hypothetical protein HYU36_01065 [Planctomycetes bacterium]|nr:hypothetical protein [Planctomycetota bacterium]
MGHIEESQSFQKAELMARAARLRYWQGAPLKEIATRLGYRNSSSVSRLLDEAWKTGVVRVVIDAAAAISPPRDPGLEAGLLDAFGLNSAVVVHPADHTPEGDLAHDDHLHSAIANVSGESLRGRIQSHTHVGLGGGRSVYHTVRRIGLHPTRCRGVTITPLTGRLWAHAWDMRGRPLLRPMDADDAAFCLALHLQDQPDVRFSQIGLPAFSENAAAAAAATQRLCHFLPNGRWRQDHAPGLAILGVGSLDPHSGHRVADLLRDTPPETQAYLRTATKELREVLARISRLSWPFCPVGDVANRLFPILPMPAEVEALTRAHLQSYEFFLSKIAALNERVISVQWRHLRQIPHVVVVAGGPHKLHALWTLLVAPKPFVTEVCTDAESARRLLRAADGWTPFLDGHPWIHRLWSRLFS